MASITINGKQYSTTKEQVIDSVKGITPKLVKSYYVEISKERYPIKQVVAVTLKIPAIAFTSMDAYRLLTKLGFVIKSEEE